MDDLTWYRNWLPGIDQSKISPQEALEFRVSGQLGARRCDFQYTRLLCDSCARQSSSLDNGSRLRATQVNSTHKRSLVLTSMGPCTVNSAKLTRLCRG